MSAEKRLEELGIALPAAATPIGNYVTTVQTGNPDIYIGSRTRQR